MHEPIPPTRVVDAEEIRTFRDLGVVCLRGILPVDCVAGMQGPVEETLRDTRVTVHIAELARAAGAELIVDASIPSTASPGGRFFSGRDHWKVDPAFAAFACRSPLPQIVAALLESERVWLYEDSVLVKEPGTREQTAWHQDLAYFQVDGDQICTTWTPLDRVDAASGAVRYWAGSHRSTEAYRPNLFVSGMSLPDTEGLEVPQLDPQDESDLVWFECEPGDVVVHHARTLHAAWGNATPDRRRRAISVRYCGDDVRYRFRPGTSRKPHHQRVREGQPLGPDEPGCPLVWPPDSAGVRQQAGPLAHSKTRPD